MLDSSTQPGSNATNPNYATQIQEFANQLDLLGDYLNKPSFLGTHYPTYGYGTPDDDIAGNEYNEIQASMQDVVKNTASKKTPLIFDLLLGAHIHLAQVTGFVDNDQPTQLVVANRFVIFIDNLYNYI